MTSQPAAAVPRQPVCAAEMAGAGGGDPAERVSRRAPAVEHATAVRRVQSGMGTEALFRAFVANVQLTAPQRRTAETSAWGVINAVAARYWGGAAVKGAILGAYGKKLAVRPPRDVDVYVELPWATKARVDALMGNVQSRLLAEVRTHLLDRYPRTAISADGPTVWVPFDAFAVEVVPAFAFDDATYLIPDTIDGGRWKRTSPWSEIVRLDRVDEAAAGAARHLIQMLKVWQQVREVPLRSIELELLALEFIEGWPYRGCSWLFYDWLVRDFFAFLVGRANTFLDHPSAGERYFLVGGRGLAAKARRAYASAESARAAAAGNLFWGAASDWQDIFGRYFPNPA